MHWRTDRIRQFFHHLFENESPSRFGKTLERLLLLLIVTNVFLAMFETVVVLDAAFGDFFDRFEAFSVAVFSIEYLIRIWAAPLRPEYSGRWGRLKFAFSLPMLFDLLALMPFYLALMMPVEWQFTRILRVIRVARIMRIAPYTLAFERIAAVIKKEKAVLAAVIEILVIALIIASAIVYTVESSVPGTKFTSIPIALWWGITTMTTVGYGDMIPVTPLGRIFDGLAAVIGVFIFALPTGLIGASFYQEVTDRRDRHLRQMHAELNEIISFTEESGEKLDQYLARQQRKIMRLEKDLEDAESQIERYKLKVKHLKEPVA